MIDDAKGSARSPGAAAATAEGGDARRRLRSPEVREHLDRLPLQTDPADFAELLAAAAREAVRADRAFCRLAPSEATAGSDRRLVAPLVEPGGDVLGELVAERAAPFDPQEAAALEALARHGGALLVILPPATLSAESEGERSAGRAARPPAPTPAPGARPAVPEPKGPAAPADLPHLKRGAADVFRREALESLRDSDEHGKPLELPSGWLRWSFRLLLVALAAGLVFLGTADVAERVAGAAEVGTGGNGGSARARVVLPGAAADRVVPGMEGRLRLDARPGEELPIRVVAVRNTGPASARRTVAEVEVADRSIEVDGGSVPLRAGMRGTAEIVVGRQPLLYGLMPGLRSLGGGGAEDRR